MEKQFATYEQSLALKELGFDEPCFAAYSEDEDNSSLFIYWNDLVNMSELFISQDNCEKFDYECLAPTVSHVFEWFREKYDLWQCIQKYPTSENPNRCYYELKGDNINADKDESPNSYMSGWFDSYEEAELECLNKLIEIVESKSE